jgi:hypothetical protein
MEVSMSPDRPVVVQAYEEMFIEFTENCTSELNYKSEQALRHVFEGTVQVLLEERKVEWDGRAKRFCLGAAAGLGREVFTKAGSNEITEDHVRDALKELVPYWERICPLPPVLEVVIRKDCDILREYLGLPPARPGTSTASA